MSFVAGLALIAWAPLVLVLFSTLPARRAVVVTCIAGWLLLPEAAFRIEGPLPDYGKVAATCLLPLLAALAFDRRRVLSLRPIPLDLPLFVWCLCPLASSLSNGFGLYDGLAAALEHVLLWGIPYVLGRVYFADSPGARELTIGIVLGGLLYVPLCLLEVIKGPQLHAIIYGFAAGDTQAPRLLGWRPVVFLRTGLAVAMWMVTASLASAWLVATARRIPTVALRLSMLALFIATVLTQSLNAWALLFVGCLLLWCLRRPEGLLRSVPSWLLVASLLAWPPVYVGARIFGFSTGQSLVPLVARVSRERAASLEYRVQSERRLIDKARQRFWVGWGKWGNARVDAPLGQYGTVPDSLWIIAFGDHGYTGLAAVLFTLLLPLAALWVACPVTQWLRAEVAPLAFLAVVVALFGIDSCFNAMPNPVYLLAAGAVSGFAFQYRARDPRGDTGSPMPSTR